MRMVILLTVAVIALVGLGLVTFGSSIAPDAVAGKSSSRSVAGSRIFTLLPDGTVEIAGARTRRVYRWDGQQWLQIPMGPAATSPGEMQ